MDGSRGQFVWHELATGDVAAAAAFYGAVLGWQGADAGLPVPYTILSVGDRPVAGAMEMPAPLAERGVPPHWTGYISVPDVDGWVQQAVDAGGTLLHGPADIPGIGRFAVAEDPQGAVFALFRAEGVLLPPEPDAPGHPAWHELQTVGWKAAFGFYAGLFGWTKAEAFDTPFGAYQLFAQDRVAIGGMTNRHDPGKPAWLFYFRVARADAAAERVREAGGQVLNGPHQVPGGVWIMHCRDPQGAAFALVSEAR